MDFIPHLLSHLGIEKLPRHCASCLFVLPTQPVSDDDHSFKITLFPTDIEAPVDQVFANSDTHNVPASSLADSAHRGCSTCRRMLSYLEELGIWEQCTSLEWFPTDLIGQGEAGKLLCHLSYSTSTSTLNDESTGSKDTKVISLELCCPPNPAAPAANLTDTHPSLRIGTPLPMTSTGSPATLSLAKSWLDTCKASHPSCAATSPFTPTRLLNISPSTLILHEPPPSSIPYAALSHRWSKSTATVILTLANFPDRITSGIRIADLPPLMRDAVHAVQALGLEWVWIDSLCIVQDSAEDWKKEAGMMAGVYMGAEFTVAATGCGGEGDGGGMFTGGRDGEKVKEMGGGLFLRKEVEHFRWLNGVGVADGGVEEQWPLLGRGWVYQEQWLSRRMVHFTKREVVWVCKSGMACECGWYRFEDQREEGAEKQCEGEGQDGTVGDDDDDGEETRPREWREIVEEYSERDFTQMTDRLPALAGIATVHEAATRPGRYLCGLWEEDLPGALLWHPKSGAKVSPRPDGTMPTWSWASTAGPVEFQYADDESARTKIMSINLTYRGLDVMGDVVEAGIRVSGPVVEAVSYHGRRWKQVLAAEGKSWDEESLEKDVGLRIGGLKLITYAPDYAIGAVEDKFLVPEETPVVCLLLSSSSMGSWDPDDPEANREVQFATGLVLRRPSDDRERYQRIGYFEGWNFDDGFELDAFNTMAEMRDMVLV